MLKQPEGEYTDHLLIVHVDQTSSILKPTEIHGTNKNPTLHELFHDVQCIEMKVLQRMQVSRLQYEMEQNQPVEVGVVKVLDIMI